jgi:3-oxoacyl-[acyl-carrier-protein] synthase II
VGLVHVPHVGREVERVRAALSSAFGFGGMDTVLAFTEADPVVKKATGSGLQAAGVAGARGAQPLRAAVITGAAALGPFGLVGGSGLADLADVRAPLETPVDTDPLLDLARARRLDRAARLGAVAVGHALSDARAPTDGTGVVLGNAFGNVDSCAAFMHRIFDRGPRAASPAEFPNLVPSSPVGHVSIYLGLHGVAFATADLAASGESAIAQAVELVQTGEIERVVAGAVEPKSDIVERVFAALFAHAASQTRSARADLAAVVVVESEEEARRRQAQVLARVQHVLAWRGSESASLAELPPPTADSEVVLPRPNGGAEALLGSTRWGACRRIVCAPSLGESDGLGAAAAAIAAGRVASGRTSSALVLGLAKGRGYALLLARP